MIISHTYIIRLIYYIFYFNFLLYLVAILYLRIRNIIKNLPINILLSLSIFYLVKDSSKFALFCLYPLNFFSLLNLDTYGIKPIVSGIILLFFLMFFLSTIIEMIIFFDSWIKLIIVYSTAFEDIFLEKGQKHSYMILRLFFYVLYFITLCIGCFLNIKNLNNDQNESEEESNEELSISSEN